MEMSTATPSNHITSTLPNSSQTIAMATPKTTSTGLPSNNSSAVAGAVAGVVAGLVICIAGTVMLIIACLIFKRRRNISKDDGQLGFIDKPVYHTTAEDKVSPEHSEETYTTLHNPLYETGKGPGDDPKDNRYTTIDGPHYDAINKDSRASPSTG